MKSDYEPWPPLPYQEFSSTRHLLHMLCQALGKLKLSTPFEPHWSNVGLWIQSQGLTTGPIPYKAGTFEVDINLIHHEVRLKSSFGAESKFKLSTTSVSQLIAKLFEHLALISVDLSVNPVPQEVPNPVPFHQDHELCNYSNE